MQAKILLFYDSPHLCVVYIAKPLTRIFRLQERCAMRSSSFNLLCRTANGLIRAAAHPFSAISSPHRSKKMVLAPGWLTGRRWRTASTRRSSKSPTGRKHRRARLPDHALVFPKTSRLSRKTRRLFTTSSRVFFSLTRVGAHTQRVFVFCLHPSPPNSRL